MDRDLHRPNYRVHDRGESGVLGCAYLVARASHVVHANMMANMDPEASIEILARPSEATDGGYHSIEQKRFFTIMAPCCPKNLPWQICGD